jgi:hypothetical protein
MRLLLLACSATKRIDHRAIPALFRYNGPAWRTLRAWLQPEGNQEAYEAKKAQLDIYAISAKYGILIAWEPISYYDQQMDAARAAEIRTTQLGIRALEEQVAWVQQHHGNYTSTLIAGGRMYQSILPEPLSPSYGPVSRTSGGIGVQLGQLKRWLEHTT